MTGRDTAGLPAPWTDAAAAPLAGDASTRRWYRLTRRPGGAGGYPATAVLMVVPPETPGVAADTVATFRLLASFGWPVPAILWARGRRAIVSDVGDLALGEAAEGPGGGGAALFYREAVDLVVDLQGKGTPLVHPRSRWARRAFTTGFFLQELEVTEQHFFRGALSSANPRWREEMALFLAPLSGAPQLLCHRDYHSRNIMVGKGNAITVVDCQDARLGPPWYDLVSLLRDSYLDLPAGLERECLEAYRRGMAGSIVGAMTDGAFGDGYLRTAVQRHLKVLGTFARLAGRGRPAYLAWVPRTVRLLRGALAPFPELAWIVPLLPPPGGA